ncbi:MULTISPECIES: hypothetical protein [unclassified Mesorhizobium]|nr:MULTISPECIES: hypothetical protein [unclassified Mesorhizobium]
MTRQVTLTVLTLAALLSPPLEPGQLLALPGVSSADQERSAARA